MKVRTARDGCANRRPRVVLFDRTADAESAVSNLLTDGRAGQSLGRRRAAWMARDTFAAIVPSLQDILRIQVARAPPRPRRR